MSNMRKSNQNVPDFAPPSEADSGFKIKVDSVRNKFAIDLELNNAASDAKSNNPLNEPTSMADGSNTLSTQVHFAAPY